MPDERKYGEREVKEIFDLASRPGGIERSDSMDESGLTLAQLQEVGREVGLEPSRIASAAAALEGTSLRAATRKIFGVPVSVGRVVELPRTPTDHEWELLVTELRTTFGSNGQVESSGGLKEWTQGNLHALIEPTETGCRLRLGTLKGSAMALRGAGVFGIVFGAFLASVMIFEGRTVEDFIGPVVFALAGSVAIASAVLPLPQWIRERTNQMEHIAQRATELLAGEPRRGE